MSASRGRVYCGLIWILSISLALVVARQVLDFMGHLWLSILVNFLHIVLLIFGLFGSVQVRPCCIVFFLVGCCAWMAWNAFIACLFLNVGSLSVDNVSSILGFGTEGPRSFWIEHTPLCNMEYNLALNTWQGEENCYFSYRYVETIIALVHFALGLLAFSFSLAFLCRISRKESRRSPRYHHPRVTMEFAEPAEQERVLTNGQISYDPAPTRNGFQSDASSGYLNTTFEPGSPSPTVLKQNGFLPALDRNGLLIQKYKQQPDRRSSKKRKKRAEEQREIVRSGRKGSPTDDEPSVDFLQTREFSDATTVELARSRRRSQSSSRLDKEQRRSRRTRSVSPIQHHERSTLESRLSPDSGFPPTMDKPHRPRSNSAKVRAYKHYAPAGYLRASGSQESNLVAARLARQHDPDCELSKQQREPRRLSVTEPRGIRNSNDSVLNSSPRKSAPRGTAPLTSLVSFDPKSNTLIRYHDHLGRSQEAVNDSTQDSEVHQEKNPKFHHPQELSDRVSYDSGHPSSVLHNHEWSSQGSSGSSEQHYAARPIGYEPSVADIAPSAFRNSKPPPAYTNGPPPYRNPFPNIVYQPSYQERTKTGEQNEILRLPSPPRLAPLRNGVLMAYDEAPEKRSTNAFLPTLTAQLSVERLNEFPRNPELDPPLINNTSLLV